jgi:hypothetical protein
MTLSKNEQIALFIVCFLVIAVAGFFVFVNPALRQMGENAVRLVEKQAEFDKLTEDYGDPAFAKIGRDIMAAYERGVTASEGFHEREYRDFEADRLIKEILAGVEELPALNNLLIQRAGTSSLDLTLHTPHVVSYNIKELATIEGSDVDNAEAGTLEFMRRRMAGASRNQALNYYKDWIEDSDYNNDDVVTAMREFLSNESEGVGSLTVNFAIEMTQEEADKLSMHVLGLSDATYIISMIRGEQPVSNNAVAGDSVDADDLDGGDDTAGDGGGGGGSATIDPGGRFIFAVEMVFYIVQRMDEPDGDAFEFLKFS